MFCHDARNTAAFSFDTPDRTACHYVGPSPGCSSSDCRCCFVRFRPAVSLGKNAANPLGSGIADLRCKFIASDYFSWQVVIIGDVAPLLESGQLFLRSRGVQAATFGVANVLANIIRKRTPYA